MQGLGSQKADSRVRCYTKLVVDSSALLLLYHEQPGFLASMDAIAREVESLEAADCTFNALGARFPSRPGTRAIVRILIPRTGDFCGLTVLRMRYQQGREQLTQWSTSKGPESLEAYRQENNATSLDGLPGLHGG